MACRHQKQITIIIMDQEHVRKDWYIDFDGDVFRGFSEKLAKEMKKMGVVLRISRNSDLSIKISSYSDLLNVVRVSSPDDGHLSQCVGHIIGKSENLDIMEDIRVAVMRVAFAPETVAPPDEFRKVCHNCGCGC